MEMKKERKYPKGYRPRVYFINCTIFYYPIEEDVHMKSGVPRLVQAAKKKLKSFEVIRASATLNEQKLFPTENLRMRFIHHHWIRQNIKGSFNEQIFALRNIVVMLNQGPVNYEFDEFIH